MLSFQNLPCISKITPNLFSLQVQGSHSQPPDMTNQLLPPWQYTTNNSNRFSFPSFNVYSVLFKIMACHFASWNTNWGWCFKVLQSAEGWVQVRLLNTGFPCCFAPRFSSIRDLFFLFTPHLMNVASVVGVWQMNSSERSATVFVCVYPPLLGYMGINLSAQLHSAFCRG